MISNYLSERSCWSCCLGDSDAGGWVVKSAHNGIKKLFQDICEDNYHSMCRKVHMFLFEHEGTVKRST